MSKKHQHWRYAPKKNKQKNKVDPDKMIQTIGENFKDILPEPEKL